MLPTDGKTTNGFESKIRWSFFNSVGNFFMIRFSSKESMPVAYTLASET